MKRILTVGLMMCGWLDGSASAQAADVTTLRCEYLVNPLGIDVMKPRLSWVIEDGGQKAEGGGQRTEGRGQRQTAYQVLVASSEALLKKDQGDVWDSGKVVSDQSIHVEYAGKPLESRMQCFWKVKVWTQSGLGGSRFTVHGSDWSRSAMWSMGLLKPEDWQAKWIGSGGLDYFRKEFQVRMPVKRATASICGLGFFDCSINGKAVGDHVMDPAYTSYWNRAMYVTFDITGHLQQGTNAVGAVLGSGHAGGTALLLQLDIVFEDGSTQQLVTDATWKVNADGPIRASSEFNGEEYDARKEFPGWDWPGFDDSAWRVASLRNAPCARLQAQMLEPMRVTQVIKPIAITSPAKGVYIVDMGQNFYGVTRMHVTGPAGTEVRLLSAYSLRADGTLKTEDNRKARCTDIYTLKGKGRETWSPRFKGQGFRRVQVTGFPGTPTLENFEGLVVHTDVPPAGEFACSSELITRIHQNIRWGQRMFKRSVPMDPDRDERQGWAGDPAKDAESDACNFNVAPFYAKWLADLRVDQGKDGSVPVVSPVPGGQPGRDGYGGAPVWPAVITILPDSLHDIYGDRRVLEENYASMKQWVDYQIKTNQKADFTVDCNDFGDWCDVSTIGINGWVAVEGKTSRALISTAYHYNNIRIVTRAARLLGKAEDCQRYEALAGQVADAFNRRFFNPTNATYASETQCAYALALIFDLVPATHRDRVIKNLADDILVKNKGHLSVGLVGMQWLMQALDKSGRNDLAYTIVTQTDRPGWGYMVSKGATTVWERWDGDTVGPLMNSEALLILSGNLDAWLYQVLAGINYDPAQPGFKHSIIKPQPLGDLTWVKANHDSMYGRIVSNWRREGAKLTMEVTIPLNTTATVYVPSKDAAGITESGKPATKAKGVKFLRMENGATVFEIGSGCYRFVSEK
ncbi:MAG: family 78 glycoside hydrolase catalytic domain [bacterium]